MQQNDRTLADGQAEQEADGEDDDADDATADAALLFGRALLALRYNTDHLPTRRP